MFLRKLFFAGVNNESEDPYPSLSDYHDYEPNLEFDDTELQATTNNGTSYWFFSARGVFFFVFIDGMKM